MYSKYVSSSFNRNSGGDEGSRTPVQKCCHIDFSEHSL
nr:MAG TPA: hypothetical protein [Caudoviricetes sp.]